MPWDMNNAAGFFPPMSVGPVMLANPTLPVAIPLTLAATTGNWNSGVLASDGYKSIAVGAKLDQTGTITIQRYIDAAGLVPVGALVSVALVASTANWATVNDGLAFGYFRVIISNTGGSTGNLTNTAVLLAAA